MGMKYGEAPENPLFTAADEGADETGGDHEDVHEEDPKEFTVGVEEAEMDGAGLEEGVEFVEHEGSGEHPVNVASVVEGAAVAAAGDVTVSGGHGEVGKGSHHADEAGNAASELTIAIGS